MKLFLKIIGFAMIGFMLIAFVLYINGVEHVDFDSRYYMFLLDVNKKLVSWGKLEIPNIPKIEKLNENNVWYAVLNAFIWFVNALSSVVNVISAIINYIIAFIQFVGALIVVVVEDAPMILGRSSGSSSSSSQPTLPII